ncbi:hypothetical protein CGLO_12770 [Colletotrichum gloeosporioides Cg-14]|nr:hypothetical protein CGLO_12770 [Colletotrichum gloeosporioides Cg-14]
MRQNSR